MTDRPSSFLLPEGLNLAALREALAPGLDVRADPATSQDRAYYDTFDGLLHAAGHALAHESGRLLLCDQAGDVQVVAESGRVGPRVFAQELPEGPLRDRVAPLIDVRALLPTVRVRVRRRALHVLDSEQKTVVRLVVDEPQLVGDAAALTARVHVTPVRGYDKELRRVHRALGKHLGLSAATGSLLGEAMVLAGLPPGGVSSKPGVRPEVGEPAASAAARICLRLLEVVQDNLPGTLADTDSEFLHNLRVAVRRTRALQRELRDVFPGEPLPAFREEFKWLQTVTGPSRDLDVYVLDFDDFRQALPPERAHDLDPLHELLVRRRASERRRMVSALRSARTNALLSGWRTELGALIAGSAGGPDATRPIEQLAGARIAKVHRQMAKAGRAIGDDSPAQDLHDLRKKGKELRYLLEFFSPLYPAQVTKPMVAALKDLQDTLGRFQDREVQAELIASLGEEVRTLPDGAPALMAMGQLVDRLGQQQAAARAEFAERFHAFAAKDQLRLVNETFR